MFQQIKTYYQNLLPDMRENDWEVLQSMLTVQYVKKGEPLLRNGEICRQVSFVNKGLLRLFYIADGREISTAFIPEDGYISAYTSFLTQQPSFENMDVLEDAELVNLSFEDMQKLYDTNPVFERFGRKIAEFLFTMVSMHTTRLLSLSPEERYQSVIDENPFVIQRVPQYMIASFIGITPEHLSRLRKKISVK